MEIDEFVGGLASVTRQGGGYRAKCPAHDDSSPSLMVDEKDGKILIKCHGGCDTSAVLESMNLHFGDLGGPQRLVAEYPYTDAAGNVMFHVKRYGPKKDFRISPAMPQEKDRVLYNLPGVRRARDGGTPLWFVEGEKDANTLISQGFQATTNATGSKARWCPNYTAQLTGCHVKIVADDDEPGRAHALRVAGEIEGKAASVELYLPASGCKDVTEHIDAGNNLEEFRLFSAAEPGVFGKFLHEMTVEQIDWAWYPYFPLGSYCLIEGDPGTGKSTVVGGDLAARFSSGAPMPDGSANQFPGGTTVLVFSGEDHPAATILPRLLAAGARQDKVKICGGMLDGAEEEPFDLSAAHLARLKAEIRKHGAKVVVIDPLMAFLPDGTESNSDHSVRRALGPIAKLAHDENCLILFVRHLNKGTGKALYRGGGSIAFTGASRGAYLVAKHPDDESIRVFSTLKMNLAPEGPSLTYRVVSDATYSVGKVEWMGVLDMGAQEVLDGPSEGGSRQDITDVMLNAVKDGPKTWAAVKVILAEAGLSHRTAERHRHKVLEKHFGGDGNSSTLWAAKKPSQGSLTQPEASLTQPYATPFTQPDQPLPPLTHNNNIYRGGGGGGTTPAGPSDTQIDPEVAEHEKELALRLKPAICDQCGASDAVRWPAPHWAVRCRVHAPRGLFAL